MNDNKFMFEAKRLDNGVLINGAIVYAPSGRAWIVEFESANAAYPYDPRLNTIEVDPSNIKPLFTTDDRDVWLFENVDKRTLSSLNENEASAVTLGWVQTGSARFGTTQIFNGSGWVNLLHIEELRANYVCRVKAPGYSRDDAMTEARNSTETAGVFEMEDMVVLARDVKEIINKFAKANGLGGKDE